MNKNKKYKQDPGYPGAGFLLEHARWGNKTQVSKYWLRGMVKDLNRRFTEMTEWMGCESSFPNGFPYRDCEWVPAPMAELLLYTASKKSSGLSSKQRLKCALATYQLAEISLRHPEYTIYGDMDLSRLGNPYLGNSHHLRHGVPIKAVHYLLNNRKPCDQWCRETSQALLQTRKLPFFNLYLTFGDALTLVLAEPTARGALARRYLVGMKRFNLNARIGIVAQAWLEMMIYVVSEQRCKLIVAHREALAIDAAECEREHAMEEPILESTAIADHGLGYYAELIDDMIKALQAVRDSGDIHENAFRSFTNMEFRQYFALAKALSELSYE